jgi:endo-alpha-1,4-polygalactosaminidase (GH114 family)
MRFLAFLPLAAFVALAQPAWAQTPAPAPGQVRAQGKALAEEKPEPEPLSTINPNKPFDFRAELRSILMELTLYAHRRDKNFQVLLRDGAAILEKDFWEYILEELIDPKIDDEKRIPMHGLLRPLARAIDGVVEDNLFCGDQPPKERDIRLKTLAEFRKLGKRVLTIDFCMAKVADEARNNAKKMGALPYVAVDMTDLNLIPAGRPADENPKPVLSLDDARNFLAVTDTRRLGPKTKALLALVETNQDLLIIDIGQGTNQEPLTKQEIYQLKFKKIGSPRKVVARMPLTFAMAGAPYWKPTWAEGNPAWLVATDPSNPDRFTVDYRHTEWKDILGRYLKWIMDLGFDGVMFDDTGGWRYFEERYPLK